MPVLLTFFNTRDLNLEKKLFKVRFLKVGPTSTKQHKTNFLKCTKNRRSE